MIDKESDTMKYYIAAEKVSSLVFHLEMAIDYFEEYNIKPDNSVKMALLPHIDKIRDWLKDE